MNILSIDTSNQLLGLAILKDGKVAGEYTTNVKKNHSVRLMPAIDQLMEETAIAPEELDRIVVAKGPGSYTGVRIGLATAKTMGWALNIPVIGISSLAAVALQGLFHEGLICPFFDARRGLVYTGLYQFNEQGKMEQVEEETNMLFVDWLEKIKNRKQKVLFLSQDMELYKETILEKLGEQAIIPPMPCQYPRPSLMAWAGTSEQPDSIHALTPEYLRLAEAEAKWLERQQENT